MWVLGDPKMGAKKFSHRDTLAANRLLLVSTSRPLKAQEGRQEGCPRAEIGTRVELPPEGAQQLSFTAAYEEITHPSVFSSFRPIPR